MNEISTFEPAIPAMIVGASRVGSAAPLGLSEPFALLGGDRLGPDGIPFRVMHEHQPAFLRWVRQSCQASLAAERPWFRGRPLLLTGASGAGRTHAARWLARVVGVPHVILNLSDPLIAASVASSGRGNEALWASPITIAMAAARCANPIVSVIGTDEVGDDVKAGLTLMVDPEAGRSWSEDQLATCIDLGEVTWVLQCGSRVGPLPAGLRNNAAAVALDRPPVGLDTTFTMSILLEAMGDLGVEPTDPDYGWTHIRQRLDLARTAGAKAVYAAMTEAICSLRRTSSGSLHKNAELY